MASNDNNPSCSGSGGNNNFEAQAADESFLEQERNRLGGNIVSVLNDSETVWKNISERQAIVHRLYAEQIIVSDKFTEYNLTWRDRDHSISENIDTFHRFTEINEQVQLLLSFLEEFEGKLDRSGKIVRDAIKDMRVHLAKLRTGLESVKEAKTLQDLKDINVPTLDWTHSIPDPEIEALAEDWDHMELELRMTQFLQELQILVLPNHEQVMDEDMR